MDEATIKKLVSEPEQEAELLRRNRDRDAATMTHLRNQVATLEQKLLELELQQAAPVRGILCTYICVYIYWNLSFFLNAYCNSARTELNFPCWLDRPAEALREFCKLSFGFLPLLFFFAGGAEEKDHFLWS
jgi:hypothetical protein